MQSVWKERKTDKGVSRRSAEHGRHDAKLGRFRRSELPQVKLRRRVHGCPVYVAFTDHSIAVDIVRQGRCMLVSSIQMQQVLVLSCLISHFSLFVLYIDGIRSSDNQMMASGLCLTAAGLAFSYATPVHTLSPVRPLRSIFHPGFVLVHHGQLVIHVFVMSYATELVHAATGEKAAFPEAIQSRKFPKKKRKMPAKRRDRSGTAFSAR